MTTPTRQVNTASRMESTGQPNRVQISTETEQTLRRTGAEDFRIEKRGEVEVKGKGTMNTFWVNCRRSQ